jgi:ABC-type branched-subunit amino acid transport system substrate-binding protein
MGKVSKAGFGIIILLAIFLFMGLFTPQLATSKLAGEEIKIGFACGLTGSCRDWCKNNLIAAEMAIEEINNTGGIGGVPIKLMVGDTASNPAEAANM